MKSRLIRELSRAEAIKLLKAYGMNELALPYRGYAVTLDSNGVTRTFIGHSPDRKWLLQEQDIPADAAVIPGTGGCLAKRGSLL